ncbi:MAG: AbrB/MazE/SpoVT family DNA-binding domain-containing protein [Candidatus Korobacteraceae bacterium]
MMRFAQISTKGQIVIPAEVREQMKLEPGTRVALEVEGDTLLLRPVTAEFIRKLRGVAKGKGLSAFWEREHRKERI